MSKKKKDDKKNEPPSLFDNLELFAPIKGEGASAGDDSDGEDKGVNGVKGANGLSGVKGDDAPKAPKAPNAVKVEPPPGLTGHGPMRELFDFNFRQYSAYVICDRAIPAVEDGFKPVQRRIMHSLWEKDDGKYTKVANIVGHAM